MPDQCNYLLVDANVLPEVFRKVVEAKMLLARGKAKSASQAAQMAGISRSAYYKYKDAVHLYDERMQENIATFYLTLEDRPGVLSARLGELCRVGADVITVSQNIPVDGVALVSVSVRVDHEESSRSGILRLLGGIDGVVEAKAV